MNDKIDGRMPRPWPVGIRAGLGVWLGFALVAVTQGILIAILLPLPATGIVIRLQHHVFDFCATLGVGFCAALVIGWGIGFVERDAWSQRTRSILRLVGFVVSAVATAVIMLQLLGYELERTAWSHFGGRLHLPLLAFGTLIFGLSIPLALGIGDWATRRKSAHIGAFVLGLAVIVGQHFLLRDDYAGLHGALAWFGASLVAMPLAVWAELVVSKWRAHTRKMTLIFAIAAGLFGLFVSPSATVRAELFRVPGTIPAWVLATILWPLPGEPRAALPPEAANSPYFQPQREEKPRSPTMPPLLTGQAPVVVLITIDATRADVVERAENEQMFPTFAQLKREGVYFTHVTSAGSQTAVALSALFSGRYSSQLEWGEHGSGTLRFVYPAPDRTLRFPELLSARGITTATWSSITFLANEFGVTRGFGEETVVVKGREHAAAEQIITPLLDRLNRVADEPFFAYAHLTEPHSPYDRGGKQGSPWQRYLREIGVADKYVGQVWKRLQERFPQRGFLIVSSDHGEAFGEHGITKHSKTLYEELLRVPLFVSGPGIRARHIDQHVTLVDLGPTILDIFGVDTPAMFMGQSLVPLLAGNEVRLDRPILAEGRLRRVLYWGDLKVIDDPRRKVVEAFDLQHDPRELRNIFDKQRVRVLPVLAALRQFFEVHRLQHEGYEMPYKP